MPAKQKNCRLANLRLPSASVSAQCLVLAPHSSMKKREGQPTPRAPSKPASKPKLEHAASRKLLLGRDLGLIRSCYRRARAFYADRRDDLYDHDTTLQKAVWAMVVVSVSAD